MRVLDVGCGVGDDVRAIAELIGETGRVTGIDSSVAFIEEARTRGVPSNASFAVGDANALPFADASFDAVRAERVFQHLQNPEGAAHELRRVLERDATALLLDQDWESLSIGGSDPGVSRIVARAYCDRLANGTAGRQARGLLLRAGFRSVETAHLIATPALPVAFELILQPAMNAALAGGRIDAEVAKRWLEALLESDRRGDFYCAVVVVIALAHS